MRQALRAGVIAGLGIAAGAAGGAEIAITPGSPGDGARIQTTAQGASIPVDWTVNLAGCSPLRSADIRLFTENVANPLIGALDVTPAPLQFNGPAVLTRPVPVSQDTDVRWGVTLTCSDILQPERMLTVSSGTRTLRLLRPHPKPRAVGKYAVKLGGTIVTGGKRKPLKSSVLFTMKPLCNRGPCRTKLTIKGVGSIGLTYNPAKKQWRGTLKGPQLGRMFVCQAKDSTRSVKRAVTGRLKIRLTHKPGNKVVLGSQTRSTLMAGTLTGTLLPTERGRRAGCTPSPVRGTLLANAR